MVSDRLKGRYKTVDVITAKHQDEEATRLIDGIFTTAIDDRPLVRIPENEFYNAWLPLFCGEPSQYGYHRQHYINRIGGSYREAIVVNAAGEEIFKIPPINDQEANNPVLMKDKELEIGKTMNRFEEERTLRPHAALHDMRTILMAHAEVMQNRKQNDKYLDEWNAIFRRYGKPEVQMQRSGKPSSGSTQQASADEQAPNTYQDI